MGQKSLNPTDFDESTPANNMMSMKDGTHEERASKRGYHTVDSFPLVAWSPCDAKPLRWLNCWWWWR